MYKSPIKNTKLLFEQIARPSRMAGPDMRKQFAKPDQAQPKEGCPTGLPGDYYPPPPPVGSGGGWNAACFYPNEDGDHETIEGLPCVEVPPDSGHYYDPSYLEYWYGEKNQSKLRKRCMGGDSISASADTNVGAGIGVQTESYKKSPIKNTKLFEQLDPKLPYEIVPGPYGTWYHGPGP
jgi:hypothetical protein